MDKELIRKKDEKKKIPTTFIIVPTLNEKGEMEVTESGKKEIDVDFNNNLEITAEDHTFEEDGSKLVRVYLKTGERIEVTNPDTIKVIRELQTKRIVRKRTERPAAKKEVDEVGALRNKKEAAKAEAKRKATQKTSSERDIG